MPQLPYTRPWYVFFLILPSGISNGFIAVVLPFLLTQKGFPVATTAGIVAIGVSANLWRFLWGPVVDISLGTRKWYWIGLLACVITLLLLCFVPFSTGSITLLSVIVFLSQVAATFILLPVNNIMARVIREDKKGICSGCYQAGSLAGTGLGGGAGLWLATHTSVGLSVTILCIASILFALFIMLIPDIPHNKDKQLIPELREMGRNILSMLKTPITLYILIFLLMPMGTGAVSYLWSAIAQDWQADADTVALVTGLLSGLASALGCLLGGWLADKRGIWPAYFICGAASAIVALLMAFLPMQPVVYIIGVLAYAIAMGMIYAAFTALVLYASGKQHVATRFSLICSLGNLPVVYMTAFNGWMHDKYNSQWMLLGEALLGLATIVVFMLILGWLRKRTPRLTVEHRL
jgi:PAT family beta-lactamase induction signal transducer AmpG